MKDFRKAVASCADCPAMEYVSLGCMGHVPECSINNESVSFEVRKKTIANSCPLPELQSDEATPNAKLTGGGSAPPEAERGDCPPSLFNAGLERIDPELLRLVELSLDAMTDYARNRYAEQKVAFPNLNNDVLLRMMLGDIERAEERLRDISAWFDGLRSNAVCTP